MNPNPAPASPQTSSLAIAALVCGIIGVCLPCPVGLAGIILGILALRAISKSPGLRGKPMAIAGMVVPFASLLLTLPILAAIAIPNFIKFQARAKQAECKQNLKSWFTAERTYFYEKGTYTEDFHELGFTPQALRYGYLASADGRSPGGKPNTWVPPNSRRFPEVQVQSALPVVTQGRLGMEGTCPDCNITAVCIGRVNPRGGLDEWSISTKARTTSNGVAIPAGLPYNEVVGVGTGP